jgi:capsular exopolysaccharide synthesis family protein
MSPEGVPVRSLCRVIVVTSASPAEGKSILALNLVASLVRAGKRTLLIDADLRRPSLHNSLGCDDNPGLSEVLTDVIPIGDAIQCPTPGLGFIAAGLICDEGLEALGRVDHAAFIGELLKEWDVVVLDTPPILSAPDGLILGGVADGVLLAVRSGVSHTEEVCEASRLLEEAGCRVLGAVLNGVAANRSVYNYRTQRPQTAIVKADLNEERPRPADGRSKLKRAGGVP